MLFLFTSARLRPCFLHLGLSFPFIFFVLDPCSVPLGMEDNRITKQAVTASSMYNFYYGPWNARLQSRNHGYVRGGWIAK